MSELRISENRSRKKKHGIIAVVVIALIVIGAMAGILLSGGLPGKGNDVFGNNDDSSNKTPLSTTSTWTGAMIPSSMMYQPTSAQTESTNGISQMPQQMAAGPSQACFVGRQDNWTNGTQISFMVNTASQITSMIGGTFSFSETASTYTLSRVVTSDTDSIPGEQLGPSMTNFNNVNVTLSSISVVYSDYTFGIGTNGSTDYVWIAPNRSYPTFFNHVSMHGMVMDQPTLSKLRSDFSGSFFAGLDLNRTAEVAASYGLNFQGIKDHFLVVDSLTYLDTTTVKGDVIDTLTPSDLARLASIFCNPGTDWIKDVIGNIGEGAAFVTESDSTSNSTKLWILIFPLGMNHEFNGICELGVSQANYSILSSEVNKNPSSFQPLTDEHRFQVRVGMILDSSSDGYNKTSVLDLWGQMGKGSQSQVESVSVRGYGVVVDVQTMTDSLGSALGLRNTVLSSITTFKNPAIVLLLDENITSMFTDDDVPFWHYGAICIIPNYDHDNSALRYLEINGTLYDSSVYFSSPFPIFRIPLVISDNCREITDGLQQVSVKDMRTDNLEYKTIGGRNAAYVEFDSQPIGTSLLSLVNLVCPISRSVTQFLPVDLGMYLAIQTDGGSHYYVPVIYLSAGKGDTYFGTKTVDIKGMYIDFSPTSSEFRSLVGNMDAIDDTPKILPTGVVFAFSLDTVHGGLEDAKAIGPNNATDKTFNVQYSISPMLAADSSIRVQLYWTDSEDLILRPIWHSYGLDPTPGDGYFPVDASRMHGDQRYGLYIRIVNGAFASDSDQPNWWTSPEAYTRVNYLPPVSIAQFYPDAPSPGTNAILNWQQSDDSSFSHYSIYSGTYPTFSPSSSNYIGHVTDQYQTTGIITGLSSGAQYYFIVRVNDLEGFHADSNMNFTRTYTSSDSGDSFNTPTIVTSGMAWTEQTTMIFDGNDYFAIYLHSGDELVVDMRGNMLGGGDLFVYDPNKSKIGESTDIGVTEEIHIRAASQGYYYINVHVTAQGTDWYTLWFKVI